MEAFLDYVRSKFKVDKRLILLYVLIYFIWGTAMDQFGELMQIAKFNYWWQVITVYVFYMVPVSLLLRGLPFHAQYAYGLIAMAFLEFSGYALQTSFAYDDNVLDYLFGIRNFSLAMAIFFALYFPLGNWGVGKLYNLIFK